MQFTLEFCFIVLIFLFKISFVRTEIMHLHSRVRLFDGNSNRMTKLRFSYLMKFPKFSLFDWLISRPTGQWSLFRDCIRQWLVWSAVIGWRRLIDTKTTGGGGEGCVKRADVTRVSRIYSPGLPPSKLLAYDELLRRSALIPSLK